MIPQIAVPGWPAIRTWDKRDFTFRATRRAELDYARRLRKIAEAIAELVRGHDVSTPDGAARFETVMQRYADAIEPWAQSVARRMIADVDRRNDQVWHELSREMSAALRQELSSAPAGEAYRALMDQQVSLIKSLPLEAAQKVHEWATEAQLSGARPAEIAAQIQSRLGDVTQARANTIARTEVGRASTTLVQVRAERIGSVSYVWRTSKDSNVRLSHRKMEGQVVRWDSPPTLDNLQGHAGALPNCRCYPAPILPERN